MMIHAATPAETDEVVTTTLLAGKGREQGGGGDEGAGRGRVGGGKGRGGGQIGGEGRRVEGEGRGGEAEEGEREGRRDAAVLHFSEGILSSGSTG